ncbi:MAG: Hsp20/alpha crystallin family protein [Candidatus Sumerlaeia bacterium]|nr:Hsp20/alpha crystallin family protein [Candidatus Sumerlaeia bacterium]
MTKSEKSNEKKEDQGHTGNRWEDETGDINRKVARVIGRVLDEVTRTVSEVRPAWPGMHTAASGYDVQDTDKALIVTLDLPGVSVKDLELSLDGRTLRVEAKRLKTHPDGEIEEKKISRAITLLADVVEDDDGIEAVLRDGVLTVTLPKPDKPAGRKINVKQA